MSVPVWICIGFFILIVAVFFRKPVMWCLKLVFNAVLGLAVMFLINRFAPGMAVGINPFTASVCGIFGVPGIALVCLLSKII